MTSTNKLTDKFTAGHQNRKFSGEVLRGIITDMCNDDPNKSPVVSLDNPEAPKLALTEGGENQVSLNDRVKVKVNDVSDNLLFGELVQELHDDESRGDALGRIYTCSECGREFDAPRSANPRIGHDCPEYSQEDSESDQELHDDESQETGDEVVDPGSKAESDVNVVSFTVFGFEFKGEVEDEVTARQISEYLEENVDFPIKTEVVNY